MPLTYCMTSNCPLADNCLRHEEDVAKNCLHRTYADFGEERVRADNGQTCCPFFKDKNQEH